jgi:hypothetical protein
VTTYVPAANAPTVQAVVTTTGYTPISIASEEQENNNVRTKSIVFLKTWVVELPSCMWVRNNYATSLGIYLVH